MRDRLQRRNRDLLRDNEVLMRAVGEARIPETLQTYRARLLTVCAKLHTLVQQNLLYLQIGQTDILEDVLVITQYSKRRFDLLSTHLAMPVLRAKVDDRLCLGIIAWQHQAQPQTTSFPPVFCDGEWGIWPFSEMGIPLYYVPSVHQRGLRFLALSFHETGHLLYLCHKKELDDLVAELQENVADMLRPLSQRNDRYAEDQAQHRQRIVNTWYAWAQELFCDAVGFTIGGPCYLYAFSHYLNMLHTDDFYQQPQDLALSSHPVTWLRIRFLTERAAAAGFTEIARDIDREWRGFAHMMGIVEDYHGFYHERLHSSVTQTIEDMLVETAPRPYTPEEAAGGGWDPNVDSPIRLLNWAWQCYLADPDGYPAWEPDQIQEFLDAIPVA